MLMPMLYGDYFWDDLFDFPVIDDKEWKKAEKKLYGRKANKLMSTDVKETKDGYELKIDLPGFKKDEVKLAFEDGYMTVSAEKGLDEDKNETGKYLRRERYVGAQSRTFYLGDKISKDEIRASFKHGILTVDVPKEQSAEAKYIQIA